MRSLLLGLSLAFAPLVAGCARASPRAATTAEAPWLGTWRTADSTAVFRVWTDGGVVQVEGWDSKDGEWFEISEVQVEGGTLRFRSIMPSTQWSLVNTLTLSGGELVNQRAGAADSVTTWVPSDAEPPPR